TRQPRAHQASRVSRGRVTRKETAMSIHQDELCREVEESIADLLGGQAPARLVDHIAGCDTCRDLKYEAEQASEMVAHAGADFRASDLGVDRIVEGVLVQRPDGPQPNHS